MKAIRLKTEFLFEPVGIDIDRPRLFWNCQGDARQTAYEIAATAEDGRTLWESGRVESPTMCRLRSMNGSGRRSSIPQAAKPCWTSGRISRAMLSFH